ncbi:hypothetical protein LQ50_20030 [Halalkalibacter okhensis]|uniref:Methyltransferase type 11 domain-containing protein n=2 Tax=Halalkalibacter okhensis TaxID=333138 RepID=A0A0B0IBD3_9BACI|nr:hypothetical protein LQ50_20030 [Halalkalibacter okhensis]
MQDWDKRAEQYTQRSEYHLKSEEQKAEWKGTLDKIIDNKSSLDMLDVGTGPGFLALLLAEMGHNCTGVDLSTKMLKIAQRKANANDLQCRFLHGDAEKLDFEDHSFDVVINRHLLWTLPHPGVALREWVRVLRPGGKLVIFDGDWTTHNMDKRRKYKQLLGNYLVMISEKRYTLNWRKRYKTRINNEKLPFEGADEGKVMSLMEAAGLSNISTASMEHLLKVDSKSFPLKYRLSFIEPYQRYIVIGEKLGH